MPISVRCKICNTPFSSLLLNKTEARNELSGKFFKHILEHHLEKFKEIDGFLINLGAVLRSLAHQKEFAEYTSDDYNGPHKEEDLNQLQSVKDLIAKLEI